MDKNEIISKVKEFSGLVKDFISPVEIVLYGSYARGNPHEDSDIDVAVVVDRFDGDTLKAMSYLFQLRMNIDVRIEPILIEREYNRGGFLESIMEYGNVIYQN